MTFQGKSPMKNSVKVHKIQRKLPVLFTSRHSCLFYIPVYYILLLCSLCPSASAALGLQQVVHSCCRMSFERASHIRA